MRGSEFVFDDVQLLCYKCHRINFNCGGSYIDCPDWITNKKATINPINTVALNYEEIKKDPQRVTKIEPFINKYNWEETNFSSEKDDWEKIEKNNVTIALNVLYAEKEKIYPAYVSENNANREKQDIFLMIPNAKLSPKDDGIILQ